jgi:acetolactate synthase-1/2/3 large subunit
MSSQVGIYSLLNNNIIGGFMPILTGAEILVKCLVREGVRYVFGVPGGELTPLLDALRKEPNIEFILARHEQAAANMADAYYRVTGGLAAAIGTVGPGAANLVSGVYPAYADGIPLIAITAQHQSWKSYPDHGSMQSLDQLSLFKPVTKWNVVVNHVERIPELFQRAIRNMFRGRHGPVHLDLPVDILFKRYSIDNIDNFISHSTSYRASINPIASRELIRKAARMLVEADNPIIHVGGGVVWSDAYTEVRELAEYLSIPVTPSMIARGVLPEDHPLYFIPATPSTMMLQSSADIVLLVGCRLGDLDFWGRPPAWGDIGVQRFIQIDIDHENIALNRPVDLALLGDAKGTLSLLLEEVRRLTDKVDRDWSRYKDMEKLWVEENIKRALGEYDGIHPMRILYEVRRFFPRDSIFVLDGGNVPVWAHYVHRIYMPRTFLWAGDSGHLGTGLPYAIAAKLARPDKIVYLVTGDGSLMFNIQEMETAYRLGTKIIVVVVNDRAYGMIRGVQKLLYRGAFYGVDFEDVGYHEIAEAMGWYGRRVVEPEEIEDALDEAFRQDRPALIDVITPRELSMVPPDLSILGELWMEGVELPE